MMRLLCVIDGPNVGQRYVVSDSFTTLLGRSRYANTQLPDMSISRIHCEIEIRQRKILLTDLDSSSGTFVNGQRVSECELKDGDILGIGNTRMRVEPLDEGKTIAPTVSVPARPVLRTADQLGELTGHKLSHYAIGPALARGQSGLIFKARDFKNNREVAFKVLWPEFSQNEDDMQRFIRAMKTMLPLRHPNLVTLYGAGKTGPYCWIAMELVNGKSVTQVLSRLGVANMLDWKRVLRLAYYLAKALQFAHARGIIHRNLTPQNVLVGSGQGQVKLGDLMLAKAQEGGLALQITKPGEVLGDLRYMAPERTAGGSIDHRADLYSLGALMYTLLTGRPPLEGKNLIETITLIRQTEPLRPKKFQLAIPDLLEGVVMKLLAKRPEDRHSSASVLIRDLARVAKFGGGTL